MARLTARRLCLKLLIHTVALLDNLWRLWNLLAQNVALEEVWQPNLGLVAEEVLGRYRENLVQFFQGKLLRLADKTEDHPPCDQIQASIKSDCGAYQ